MNLIRFIAVTLLFTLFTNEPFANEELCRRNLDEVFADQRVSIDVFLGYYDNTPRTTVANTGMVQKLYRTLLRPCSGPGLCGFKTTRTPGRLYKRTSTSSGVRDFIITIYDGHLESANPDPNSQKNHSRSTQSQFEDRLEHGEVVLYFGHSRYGGGPDFFPPKVTNGHVNEDYYKTQRRGVDTLQRFLRTGSVKVYGSFSCDSIRHFKKVVKTTNPTVTYIGSTLAPSYRENESVFYTAFESILTGSCKINERMRKYNLPAEMR